jgi:hypothetical protein
MGISKLNCTLKGEVPTKWPLDEDVPFAMVGIEGCGKKSPSFHTSFA